MEPAVTTVLDRAFSPGLTAWDAVEDTWAFVASTRAGSPRFGCKRSPQQAESLTAGSDHSSRNPRSSRIVAKVISP